MRIRLLSLLLLLTLAVSVAAPVSAQILTGQAEQELEKQNTDFLSQAGLGKNLSLGQFVAAVIKVVLAFLGVIFIILIIYSGLLWMTSAGNEEKIETAKKTIVAATIGLAIVLSAYAITYFVIDKLLEATRGGSGLD